MRERPLRGGEDLRCLVAVEALLAFLDLLAHAHLHLLGGILGEQSLIDGELEQRLGRGEVERGLRRR